MAVTKYVDNVPYFKCMYVRTFEVSFSTYLTRYLRWRRTNLSPRRSPRLHLLRATPWICWRATRSPTAQLSAETRTVLIIRNLPSQKTVVNTGSQSSSPDRHRVALKVIPFLAAMPRALPPPDQVETLQCTGFETDPSSIGVEESWICCVIARGMYSSSYICGCLPGWCM